MNYSWNWRIFWEQSPDGADTYFDLLLLGLKWTIATAACAWVLALFVGAVVGILRTSRHKFVEGICAVHVEVFRNVPLLVQLFLWYFVLPEVLPSTAGLWLKHLPSASFFTSVVGLGLFMSARVAEIVRAGVTSVPIGQRYAGLALGLSETQVCRFVLLPVATRTILPPLTSELLNTIKNTSVALTIGLPELTAQARAMQEFSFQVFESFAAATALYFAINGSVAILMRFVERRLAIPSSNGAE